MTKAKKAISVVLAVVMIAGLFAFGAFAADQNATIAVSASETQVEVGATVTVTVAATTDYYAAAASVPVYYDAAAFDLVPDSVTPSTDLYGAGYTDTAINTTEAGCVMVAFIPKAGGTAQQLNNTTLFTFQLTAKANAQASPIATKAEDQKTATNIGGKLYLGAYSTADVNTATVTAVGQEFSLTNATVTVGSGATVEPELQLSETGSSAGGVISTAYGTADGYDRVVMGLDTLGLGADGVVTSLTDALTTPAGRIEIDTDASSGVETTGTLIKLYSDSDELLETYVFVYFGDVNMDGSVDSSDATAIEEYEFFVAEINEEYRLLAADANGDTSPDSSDATTIEEYEFFVIEALPSQADCAAVYA